MPCIGRVVSMILLLPAFVLLSPDESFLAGPAAANAQGLIRNSDRAPARRDHARWDREGKRADRGRPGGRVV